MGTAPRWRLTELGFQKQFPTQDFKLWAGEKFTDAKSKPRAVKPARGVRVNQHVGVAGKHSKPVSSVPGMPHKAPSNTVQTNGHRTRLPYHRVRLRLIEPADEP